MSRALDRRMILDDIAKESRAVPGKMLVDDGAALMIRADRALSLAPAVY